MPIQRLDLIGHSGFALETDRCVLVFDLFTDTAGVMPRVLALGKPVVFFSSHAHFDHWSPRWLDYEGSPLSYLLDRGCVTPELAARVRPEDQRLMTVDPYGSWTARDLFGDEAERFAPGLERVRTFGSTDLGVSFLLNIDGQTVFHAGDLNDWYWEEESNEQELVEADRAFRSELSRLRDAVDETPGRGIDLAFFPVDARLGRQALRGGLWFAAEMRPELLVPMHLSGGQELPARLAEELTAAGIEEVTVLDMTEPGQTRTLDKGETT